MRKARSSWLSGIVTGTLWVLLSLSSGQAATINVPADQPTIQAGIDAAMPGDTVLVAPGSYSELVTLQAKNLTIISVGGRSVTLIAPSSSGNIITFLSGVDTTTLFSGFTVKNSINAFGIFCSNGASPRIEDNDISFNTFGSNGAGIWIAGGAPKVRRNLIHDNTGGATSAGIGGFTLMSGSPLEISRNDIYNNTAHNGPGIGFTEGAGILIKYNIIRDNIGTDNFMGGVYINGTNSQIYNNTIIRNSMGITILDGNGIDIRNNIVALSVQEGIKPASSTVDYNDVWNNGSANDPGPNGISADPQFASDLSSNFYLKLSSPCIDAGDPDSVHNGPDGSRNDIGALQFVSCFGLPGPDSDADGSPDSCDICPNDPLNDVDGDGICGVIDNCPIAFNPSQEDSDGDSIGDACDNCPLDFNTAQTDTDGDGLGDLCDICSNDSDNDIDGDDICGDVDNCPAISNSSQTDSDGDGIGDLCDLCPGFDDNIDADSDGTPDGCDECPNDPDKVLTGTCGCGVADTDTDSDGTPDCLDICPGSNDAVDSDGDGVPNGCDICNGFDDNTDTDGDFVPDGCDMCPGSDDAIDADGDSVPDECDNCPSLFNTSQLDSDNDGIGNGCDNCPTIYNPDQLDSNNDGVGDACLQTSVVPDGDESLPRTFQLYQNFPNPFNPTTKITLDLPVVSDWSIIIYNVLGQIIKVYQGRSGAGTITVEWDASNMSSGVYLYKAVAGTFTTTRKMLLLK